MVGLLILLTCIMCDEKHKALCKIIKKILQLYFKMKKMFLVHRREHQCMETQIYMTEI